MNQGFWCWTYLEVIIVVADLEDFLASGKKKWINTDCAPTG